MVKPLLAYTGVIGVGLCDPSAFTVALIAASVAVILAAATTVRAGSQVKTREAKSPHTKRSVVVRLSLLEWLILTVSLDSSPKTRTQISRDLVVCNVDVRASALSAALLALSNLELIELCGDNTFKLTQSGRQILREAT